MVATVPVMPTIRFLWIEPGNAMKGWQVELEQQYLDAGKISTEEGEFPGPAGTYHLLTPGHSIALEPHDPMPIFLHESYDARIEEWRQSLTDAADEVAIIGRVRDAVIKLADSRLAANPQAFAPGPTVTTTEPTPQGMAVIGRCIILQPAA